MAWACKRHRAGVCRPARMPEVRITGRSGSAQIYPPLTMLRDQEGSIIRQIRTFQMDRSLENRIRERAYEIWTAHGCIHGQADQHWVAAEREILTESTATLAGVQQKRRFRARSKKSDWRRELRVKFFGMLFGVAIAAVGAAAFSLGAHHNGSAPASPGPTHETAAPASAPKVGAEVTASKRVEATSVDTDRASTASDVTSGGKSNVATTCEASGAACGVLVGRGDAPNGTGAGGAWTNVPETPAPA